FRFSVKNLQMRLSNIPWVEQATVTRNWPGQLVIEFTEYHPVAVWNNSALITADGAVFLPGNYAKMPTGLPMLKGPNAEASSILANYEIMQRMLNPLHLQIKEIDVSNRLAWNLLLDDGMLINLGEQHPIERLQTFVAAYPQVFTKTGPAADYVDMRYDHGMSVHWETQAKVSS
ncbi:MAG: cell division protein FtsQ/DivIB, partial [Gammaproteobacteria bacterium]